MQWAFQQGAGFHRAERQHRSQKGRRKAPQEKSELRHRVNSLRMIVCLSAIPILLAIKFLFPAGARAVSDHLAGGLDYKAAFAALGRAITGEEKLAEVFRGISFGAFQKDRGGSESTDGENKDGGLQSENGNAAGKTQLNDDDEKGC